MATQHWLANAVQVYPNSDRAYSDVLAALQDLPNLRPKSELYTFDDGRTQLLICVHGLLPITYRNASYNIPIALWIPREYPRQPPISYVVPTPNMLVKPSKYVDVSGRCDIEYTQNWSRKSESCNLRALLQSMQHHFSTEPPLYARPLAPPALPPKPSPPPTLPIAPVIASHATAAPVPPRPPSHPLYRTPHPSPPRSHPIPPQAPTTFPTSPSQVHPSLDLLDGDSPNPDTSFVPPPPRPPNPELLHLHSQIHQKLISETSSLSQVLALDADRLRAHQTDLLAGEPAVRDEMARLEAVRDVCSTVSGRLHASIQQAEINIAQLRRKGDPELDELVCSTTIVYNQLISLVAEDNAIEDTIYQLHRALNAGRINLERFLKSTRMLAEEQFLKRALIDKITAGISTWS